MVMHVSVYRAEVNMGRHVVGKIDEKVGNHLFLWVKMR